MAAPAPPAASIASPKPSGPDPVQIEMALWDSVKSSSVSAEIQAYVNKYPSGFFVDVAKARMAALHAATSGRSASDKAAADAAAAERAGQQAQAGKQAQEMAFWDNIKVSNKPAELEAYISQFPNGLFVGLARVRLADGKAVAAAVANAQSAQAAVQAAAPVITAAAPVAGVNKPVASGGVAVAAAVVPVQSALPSIASGVLGQVVVTDQLTNKKQTIDVVVLEKTDQFISYSTGDKVTSDGKVLAARLGTYVAGLRSGTLWQFPLQAGSSGSAVTEFAGLPDVPVRLAWKVKSVSGQRSALDVEIFYIVRGLGGGATVTRYGSWQAEYIDGVAIPVQYKYTVRGLGLNDLFAGDFNKITSK